MLTEKEKEWMERRKKNEKEYGSVYCLYCTQFIAERDEYIGHCYDDLYCLLTDHFFPDVAEFEARVAEKLATVICSGCEDFNKKNVCPLAIYQTTGIYECRMMHARLAVEAEMDK